MNDINHFAIHADDLDRARSFYETVFGWTFTAWGPPGFYLIKTSDTPDVPHGSLQSRSQPRTTDDVCGFECTVNVADVDKATTDIVANGGTIVYEKSIIHGVGEIIRFRDTEGNFLCAMRYDASV